MGEDPSLWANFRLVHTVRPDDRWGHEAQVGELLRLLQLGRLQSLKFLRLECRTLAENCARYLRIIVDNHPAVTDLDLKMTSDGPLSPNFFTNLAAALVKFEKVDLFFFREDLHQLTSEILTATLTASTEPDSKLKTLTMPGNQYEHAEAISEAGIQVKLIDYDIGIHANQIDYYFGHDSDDYYYDSDDYYFGSDSYDYEDSDDFDDRDDDHA